MTSTSEINVVDQIKSASICKAQHWAVLLPWLFSPRCSLQLFSQVASLLEQIALKELGMQATLVLRTSIFNL